MPPSSESPTPPFDPARMLFTGASPGGHPSPEAAADSLTVSQLAAMIGGALRQGLPGRVRVVGEISGLSRRTHWYFTLKDEHAVIGCVLFGTAGGRVRRLAFEPRDGQKVLATGRVEHYARQGRTQLYVDELAPIGEGALEQRFRALCEELRGLGWFDEARKRPLPAFPARIAIVTSRTGAALQDVLDTLRRRRAPMEALVVDVRVQGPQAAPEIARAVRWLSEQHRRLGIDAVFLTRGGGSIEDLWAFNERIVAEAIVRCAVPVIAAIGHETDVTIAELVADVRAATPTQGAVRVAPDGAALGEQVEQLAARLHAAAVRRSQHARERLRGMLRHPLLARPSTLVEPARSRIREIESRLHAGAHARIARASVALERASARLAPLRPEAVFAVRRARLSELATRLRHAARARVTALDVGPVETRLRRAVDAALHRRRDRTDALGRALTIAGPMSVLGRGFSVTMRADGAVLRDAAHVRTGEALRTRLANGAVWSEVVQSPGGSAGPDRPATRPRRRTARRPEPPSQGWLFEPPAR